MATAHSHPNVEAIASCAAPAKPNHPVLANVLVVAAKAQQVHLSVTDLAMTIQASFEVRVLLGSEITVPVEMLSRMGSSSFQQVAYHHDLTPIASSSAPSPEMRL